MEAKSPVTTRELQDLLRVANALDLVLLFKDIDGFTSIHSLEELVLLAKGSEYLIASKLNIDAEDLREWNNQQANREEIEWMRCSGMTKNNRRCRKTDPRTYPIYEFAELRRSGYQYQCHQHREVEE